MQRFVRLCVYGFKACTYWYMADSTSSGRVTPPQEELVLRCQRGDRRAQSMLYQQYARLMYNHCLRMLGKAEDAEDAMQMAFVDVFTHIDSFRFEASVGSWIKRIVTNSCINLLRQRKLQWEELGVQHDVAFVEEPADEQELMLSVEAIRQAVQQLPDGYRVVLTLYLFEGYDHQEIASILDISEATSKSQYSRARRKLRELLC